MSAGGNYLYPGCLERHPNTKLRKRNSISILWPEKQIFRCLIVTGRAIGMARSMGVLSHLIFSCPAFFSVIFAFEVIVAFLLLC